MSVQFSFHGPHAAELLAHALHEKLQKALVWHIFSTSPRDLIFQCIDAGHKPFEWKISFQPNQAFLFLSAEHQALGHKNLPQFQPWSHQECTAVDWVKHDRSFVIRFRHAGIIWVRLYGPQANVVGFEEEKVWVFRKHILSDSKLKDGDWERLPTMPPKTGTLPVNVFSFEEGFFHWIADGKRQFSHADWLTVYQRYAAQSIRRDEFSRQKQAALGAVKARLKKNLLLREQVVLRATQLKSERSFEEIGHLILSHLHDINHGDSQFIAEDYFHPGERISITLKKDLSPQENAAYYFRKAKNRHIESETLDTKWRGLTADIQLLEAQLAELENAATLKELKTNARNKPGAQAEVLPYKEVMFQGFRIRIGKNAKANDELTLKVSRKFDWWFHAHGYSGSHVVVVAQNKNNLPAPVLERAAQLAAFYSKAKHISIVPVMFTQVRYVRKPRGAEPGAMQVTSFKIMDTTPQA